MNVAKILTTVDTHTAGGPTRTITGGLPPLQGKNVAEKMEYFRSHHDSIRKLLISEPRGHKDMYGAVITEASAPDADIGAFFFTAGGYLPACVHSAIGIATAGLETGFLTRPDQSIKMEVPAGVISLLPRYEGEHVDSIAIQTPPAFVYSPVAELTLGDAKPMQVSIVFSGVFFILVDIEQLRASGMHPEAAIRPEGANEMAALGVRILEAANHGFDVQHPEKPGIDAIELVMIYEEAGIGRGRDIVINRGGGIDRSPCGAGTGAKVTDLFVRDKLQENQEYILESFIGTQFIGRVLEPAEVGPYHGAVPEIRGTAHITGMHQFVLDARDPLSEGFLF